MMGSSHTLWQLGEQGKLKPHVSAEFPPDRAKVRRVTIQPCEESQDNPSRNGRVRLFFVTVPACACSESAPSESAPRLGAMD